VRAALLVGTVITLPVLLLPASATAGKEASASSSSSVPAFTAGPLVSTAPSTTGAQVGTPQSTVTSGTTRSMKGLDSGTGWSWSDVWKTLLSALVGAVLAIVGARLLEAARDRRIFRDAAGILREEISLIDQEAAARSVPPDHGGLQMSAPLPTTAWQTMVASGMASRFADLGPLMAFYREVDGANYLVSLVPIYLQTANLSPNADVQEIFANEASRLSVTPFDLIRAKTAAALAEVDRSL
jgi:hypothetical protein